MRNLLLSFIALTSPYLAQGATESSAYEVDMHIYDVAPGTHLSIDGQEALLSGDRQTLSLSGILEVNGQPWLAADGELTSLGPVPSGLTLLAGPSFIVALNSPATLRIGSETEYLESVGDGLYRKRKSAESAGISAAVLLRPGLAGKIQATVGLEQISVVSREDVPGLGFVVGRPTFDKVALEQDITVELGRWVARSVLEGSAGNSKLLLLRVRVHDAAPDADEPSTVTPSPEEQAGSGQRCAIESRLYSVPLDKATPILEELAAKGERSEFGQSEPAVFTFPEALALARTSLPAMETAQLEKGFDLDVLDSMIMKHPGVEMVSAPRMTTRVGGPDAEAPLAPNESGQTLMKFVLMNQTAGFSGGSGGSFGGRGFGGVGGGGHGTKNPGSGTDTAPFSDFWSNFESHRAKLPYLDAMWKEENYPGGVILDFRSQVDASGLVPVGSQGLSLGFRAEPVATNEIQVDLACDVRTLLDSGRRVLRKDVDPVISTSGFYIRSLPLIDDRPSVLTFADEQAENRFFFVLAVRLVEATKNNGSTGSPNVE